MKLRRLLRRSDLVMKCYFLSLRLRRKLNTNNNGPLMVNIGAGDWYCKGWRNLDFISSSYKWPPINIDYYIDLVKMQPFPFLDDSVYLFYCCHVFEHLPNVVVEHVCREVYRSLIPGGGFRILVPSNDEEALVGADYDYDNADRHINTFTFDKLSDILMDAGFIKIYESIRGCSMFPEMRGRLFDRRRDSLFVEAVK